jgi:hypothetical protein
MSLTEDMDRGQKAAKLLSDPLLIAAKEEVSKAIHEAWERAPIRDREGAHELRLMLKALSDVWALLETAVANGKMSAMEFDQLNHRAEK